MQQFRRLLFILTLAVSTLTLAEPPEAPDGKRWTIVGNMTDEFNGNSLNLDKWGINSTGWRGRPPGRFLEDNVRVSGGSLQLTASKLDNPFPVENPSPEDLYQTWTHGGALVASNHRATYGYYETRMRANKTFMSSTFWLINRRGEGTDCDLRVTELDITETVGWNSSDRNFVFTTMSSMNSNTHSRQTNCESTPVGSQGGKAEIGENAYENYHIYGVWWKSKDELLFYLNNEYQYTIKPPADFDLPMYLRMVVETYNWNAPNPGNDGIDGSLAERTTYYDWTRTWELVDEDTQTPFRGQTTTIPGTIEAERFDEGGQGVAYNDSNPNNNGSNVARENEAVDIQARDGGVTIGWTTNGEWLEYTLNSQAGTYDLEARVAAVSSGKSIVVKLDGSNIGTFNIPNTGAWESFQTIKIPNVNVGGGNGKVLRIEFVGGGVNLNWIRFSQANTARTSAVTPTLSPTSTPGSEQIDVYPNPLIGGNELTIDLNSLGDNVNVLVFDAMGRKVFESFSSDRFLKLQAEVFPTKGLYLIQINSFNRSERYKLLVK
ncbi:MAG: carbohydrate-binding protein [Bacteroidota bacterium]